MKNQLFYVILLFFSFHCSDKNTQKVTDIQNSNDNHKSELDYSKCFITEAFGIFNSENVSIFEYKQTLLKKFPNYKIILQTSDTKRFSSFYPAFMVIKYNSNTGKIKDYMARIIISNKSFNNMNDLIQVESIRVYSNTIYDEYKVHTGLNVDSLISIRGENYTLKNKNIFFDDSSISYQLDENNIIKTLIWQKP
jgi:hypothetical protein